MNIGNRREGGPDGREILGDLGNQGGAGKAARMAVRSWAIWVTRAAGATNSPESSSPSMSSSSYGGGVARPGVAARITANAQIIFRVLIPPNPFIDPVPCQAKHRPAAL